MTCGSERPEPYRRRLGVPLRARASPAPRKGEDSEGAVEAPSERTQQMGLFQQPPRGLSSPLGTIARVARPDLPPRREPRSCVAVGRDETLELTLQQARAVDAHP